MELLKIFNSQAERDTVLLAIKECQEKHDVMRKQGLDRQSRKSIKQEIKKLETEYESRLPIQSLSVCPFCGETFQLEMDPFGLIVSSTFFSSKFIMMRSQNTFVEDQGKFEKTLGPLLDARL